MKNKVSYIGFFLVAAATVLAIVSAILYNSALYKQGIVFTLLICAAAAGLIACALAAAIGKEIPNLFVVAQAVLLMAALAASIAPMVNEIGLVYAGLNQFSGLVGYIVFAAFACVTWLIATVASFTGITKKA